MLSLLEALGVELPGAGLSSYGRDLGMRRKRECGLTGILLQGQVTKMNADRTGRDPAPFASTQ